MAWLYSPVLPVSSGALVLSSETPIEPCVMSSGTLTPRPPSWHGWRTRRWIALLCGTTFPPSTVARGVDSWISSLEASHAKIFPMPGSAPASRPGSGRASGSTTPESFATLAPGGFLPRTSVPSLEEGWASFLETLPSSGSMRSGSLFERPTWAPRTAGKGSSSSPSGGTAWTTPCASENERGAARYAQGGTPLKGQAQRWQTPATDSFRSRGGERKDEEGLDQQARHWATPNAHDGQRPVADIHSTQGRNLDREVALWPTPRVRSTLGDSCSPQRATQGENLGLNDAAAKWPTPRANEGSSPNQPTSRRKDLPPQDLNVVARNWPSPRAEDSESCGNHPDAQDSLSGLIKNWPTPSARDMKGTDIPNHHGGASLSHFVETGQRSHSLPQDQETGKRGKSSSPTARSSPLRLNPAFVCWLMGWPWWWTRAERISFAAREMESWTSRQRALLWSLVGDSEQES
jgi:hypothetical protein